METTHGMFGWPIESGLSFGMVNSVEMVMKYIKGRGLGFVKKHGFGTALFIYRPFLHFLLFP